MVKQTKPVCLSGRKPRRVSKKEADTTLMRAMKLMSKHSPWQTPILPMQHVKDPYENPKDRLGINKVPLHLIPDAALIHEAMAMWVGGVKYGPFNWREKKVVASIYVAAARRHLTLYFDTREHFAKDGIHHLGHVRACCGIILDAEANNMLVDDRPPPGASSQLIGAYNAMLVTMNRMMDEVEGTSAERFTNIDWKVAQQVYYDKLKEEQGQ